MQFSNWPIESVREQGFQGALKRLWIDAHVDGETAHHILIEILGTAGLAGRPTGA